MTDAYYPAQDPGIMATSPAFTSHDPARAHEADRRRDFAPLVPDTRRDFAPLVPDTRRARFAVLENHCRQARAGYFYCESTPGDPCGYSPANRHPHDRCTVAECTAPHTCGDLGAYAAATAVQVIDNTDGRGFEHACRGSWRYLGDNSAGHEVYACDSGKHVAVNPHRSALHKCLTCLHCTDATVTAPAS